MPANRRKRPPIQCRNQRGAAAMITVLFLLIVVGFAVLVSLDMSGSDVSDSTSQHNSVQALFLAESAIERAAGRYAAATPCASLAPDSASLASGSFTVATATVVGANCQIRATGTAAGNTRTVDAVLRPGGGAITTVASVFTSGQRPANTALTLSHTVPAGASILLVGISFRNTQDNNNPTVTVSYGGTAMTLAVSASGGNPWPRAQIWYLISPPTGTANVSVRINKKCEIVLGAKSFSGVNTATGATAPFDVAATTNARNSKVASVPITPATSGAWVFEVAAMNSNDVTTMTPQANRTFGWFAQSNGNVRGAASTIGPVSPVAAQNPRWTWNTGNNARWSHAAVALRPGGGGSPQLLTWTEAVN